MTNITKVYHKFNIKGIDCDECFDGKACWSVGKGERTKYFCQECKNLEIKSDERVEETKKVMNWGLQRFLSSIKSSFLSS